jgi:hypothetical protein
MRLAAEGWGVAGGLGGLAALIWALSVAIDRLVRSLGGLAITYRAVFSPDDRPIQRLQLVLGAGQAAEEPEDDLDQPASPPAA